MHAPRSGALSAQGLSTLPDLFPGPVTTLAYQNNLQGRVKKAYRLRGKQIHAKNNKAKVKR